MSPPNPGHAGPTPHAEPDSDSGAETCSSSDYDYVRPNNGYGFAYDSEVEVRHAGRRGERENTGGSTIQLSEAEEGDVSGDTCSGFEGDSSNVSEESSIGEDGRNMEEDVEQGGHQRQEEEEGRWDEQYDADLEEGPLLGPPPADRSSINYLTPTPRSGIVYTTSITATLSGPSGVLASFTHRAEHHGQGGWHGQAGRAAGVNHEFRGRNRDERFEGRGDTGEDVYAGAQEDGDENMEEEEEAIGGHAHHVPHVHRGIYGHRRGGNTYGRDNSDDDASAEQDDADDEMSPEPDRSGVAVERSMRNAFLYGDPVVSKMVADVFMQRYTQALSAAVVDQPPNTECPICLEPPSETHECVQISGVPGCMHLIGRACLRQWFVNRPDGNKDCPFCRTQWLSQQEVWDIEDELIDGLVVPGPWRE
ncbi:hypothetical protein BM1_10324 [Bipolaris maydis]|nr:hypothetical protein BM1_10324 [Bipolaris maydis]